MIGSIAWKEWREQRWKLLFGTVMLSFFAAALLVARQASAQEAVIGVWIFGGLILALYSGMGVFAPERTNGTDVFLSAKPVRPEWVFLIKWLFGWLNVATPMVVSLVLAIMISEETPRVGLGRIFAAGLGMSTMYYTLTCCLAPRRSGEATVGLVGLLVFAGSLMYMWPFTFHALDTRMDWFIVRTPFYVSPFSWVLLIDNVPTAHGVHLVMMQAMVLAAGLWIGMKKWKR